MKQPKFNLDLEFIRWYYEQEYPEQGSNRSMVHGSGFNPSANVNIRDYWMRESFKQGAQAMWQDINAALLDYACAVEGLAPELLTPSEVYDRARENLYYYVHTQLELF